jgi:hypothetical protein
MCCISGVDPKANKRQCRRMNGEFDYYSEIRDRSRTLDRIIRPKPIERIYKTMYMYS